MGFLTAGNDLMTGVMNIAEAEALCNARAECNGFTFRHNAPPSTLYENNALPPHEAGSSHTTGAAAAVSRDEEFEIFFKRAGPEFVLHDQWLAYTKPVNGSAGWDSGGEARSRPAVSKTSSSSSSLSSSSEEEEATEGIGDAGTRGRIGSCDDETCHRKDLLTNESGSNNSSSGRTYRVDVYRRDPLVLVVRDFVTPAECAHMIQQASPKLTPAQVGLLAGAAMLSISNTILQVCAP